MTKDTGSEIDGFAKILDDAHEMGVIKGQGLANDYAVLRKGMLKKAATLCDKRIKEAYDKGREDGIQESIIALRKDKTND